jgi:hypothetical protein
MDTLTYWSKLVEFLAWPTASIIIAFGLKQPLVELLDRLKTAKHKDTEFAFNPKNQSAPTLGNEIVLAEVIPQDSLGLINDAKLKILGSLDKLGLNSVEDKIEVLAAHHANLQIRSSYTYINLTIYKSQIDLLQALNVQPNHVEAEFLVSFYSVARDKHSEYYKNISFEDWLNYLKVNGLVNTESGKYFLTVMGRGFLAALVEAGINQPRNY